MQTFSFGDVLSDKVIRLFAVCRCLVEAFKHVYHWHLALEFLILVTSMQLKRIGVSSFIVLCLLDFFHKLVCNWNYRFSALSKENIAGSAAEHCRLTSVLDSIHDF